MRTYNGVLGTEPLVRESGGKVYLKVNAFLRHHNPMSGPICPKIVFLQCNKLSAALAPLDPPVMELESLVFTTLAVVLFCC